MYESTVPEDTVTPTLEIATEMTYPGIGCERDWNDEFQGLLEQPNDVSKWSALSSLVKDFEEVAAGT